MDSSRGRLRRTTAALATAGLLGLPAACSAAEDTSTDTASAGTSTAAGTAAATKAEGAASGDGMKTGCDTVHELFAALDSGDQATAKSLKDKGKATFDGIAKADDPQLASNATAMAQMLEFPLPEQPIYQSELAEVYSVDCVAQYGAAKLPS